MASAATHDRASVAMMHNDDRLLNKV